MDEDLWTLFERWEREVNAAGLSAHTKDTYIDRVRRFLRWVDGDYELPKPKDG